MRLLQIRDDGSLSLVEYVGKNIPPYAILSHTWAHEEVTFQDVVRGVGKDKDGYRKIKFCGEQASREGLEYFWVDTCCIDKASSAELSEALNSMFRYYQKAAACYVYLSDVAVDSTGQNAQTPHPPTAVLIKHSRWFTRGWTLQELLAPVTAHFFSNNGVLLGDKKSLEDQIHEATGIPVLALRGRPLSEFSTTERTSWAGKRDTTIEEDRVYCLLGIFNVHLPVIYGEGLEHAFRRLSQEISKGDSTEEADICLAKLAATDQTRFLQQTLHRSKGSCVWITKNRKYATWCESKHSSLLWISAKAGCGKTTIAAHVSSAAILPRPDNVKSVVLSFFFRRSNHEAEKTAQAAMRTLASQLIRQEPQLNSILLRRHRSLSAKGDFEWSWEQLSSLLSEMLDQTPLGTTVYIILDALDECDSTSRVLLLEWTKALVPEAYSSHSTSLEPTRKILVTARPCGDILDHLQGFPILQVANSDTRDDIQALIQGHMQRFARNRSLDQDVTRGITQFLDEHAQGMFLWVVLVMEELERRDERLDDEVIASKLSKIPLTLIENYELILGRTIPTRKQDMWRIFRWLLYGTRNLTLAELEMGMCLETGVTNWFGFAGDVEYLCGSLIRLEGRHGEVSFIHQTARTFVETHARTSGRTDVSGIELGPKAAHECLAMTCVQYLLQADHFTELNDLVDTLWTDRPDGVPHHIYHAAITDFLLKYSFLPYAIESWDGHVREAGKPSPALRAMVLWLLSSSARRRNIMILMYFLKDRENLGAPSPETPLYLAAYANLPFFVDIFLLEDDNLVNTVGTDHDTPLIWASETGSVECIKKLLDAGADPNIVENDGWTALHWAARSGHVDAAKLLLSYGARSDARDSDGDTPLDWALERGHRGIIDLLRKQQADHWDSKYYEGKRQHETSAICSNSRTSGFIP